MEVSGIAERRAERRRMEVEEAKFSITNPATGEKVGEYPLMGPEEVGRAIERARRAFPL
jgi:acyl-CoA reductase-like NAD-dependent aldehyde dehydrogenase